MVGASHRTTRGKGGHGCDRIEGNRPQASRHVCKERPRIMVVRGQGVEGTNQDRWRAVRHIKRDLTNGAGANTPFGEKAHASARDLDEKHWRTAPGSPRNQEVWYTFAAEVDPGRLVVGPPMQEEIDESVAALARGRAEGVGGVSAELLKRLGGSDSTRTGALRTREQIDRYRCRQSCSKFMQWWLWC